MSHPFMDLIIKALILMKIRKSIKKHNVLKGEKYEKH